MSGHPLYKQCATIEHFTSVAKTRLLFPLFTLVSLSSATRAAEDSVRHKKYPLSQLNVTFFVLNVREPVVIWVELQCDAFHKRQTFRLIGSLRTSAAF